MSVGSDLYQRGVAALIAGLTDARDEIPRLFEALVAEHFETSTLAAGTKNAGDKLHTGRGDLRRALIVGRKGNIWKADLDVFNSQFEYGIDDEVIRYANTHEYGDTRPITIKMRRFFWAMYYKTGEEMWRGLALTKKTELTWEPRPFMAPAEEDFDKNELPSILNIIFIRMAIAFNAN